jgi:hypothetical protein
MSAVVLLGVPGWRPPRRSPGLDPLGIAIFATFFPFGAHAAVAMHGLPCTFLCTALRVAAFGLQRESA